MRISDWSSDVCSSDLPADRPRGGRGCAPGCFLAHRFRRGQNLRRFAGKPATQPIELTLVLLRLFLECSTCKAMEDTNIGEKEGKRSDERRGGKECVSTCRSRW